jgi:hypothetical protein
MVVILPAKVHNHNHNSQSNINILICKTKQNTEQLQGPEKNQCEEKQKHMMHMMSFFIQFQSHGNGKEIPCATWSKHNATQPLSPPKLSLLLQQQSTHT